MEFANVPKIVVENIVKLSAKMEAHLIRKLASAQHNALENFVKAALVRKN